MKEILKEFIGLFSNAILVICLMLASYLILINLYHYREVHYQMPISVDANTKYQMYKTTVDSLDGKLSRINTDTIANASKKMFAKNVESALKSCVAMLKNSEYYKVGEKTSLNIKDVYQYNLSLKDDIQIQCLFQVAYTTSQGNKTYDSVAGNVDEKVAKLNDTRDLVMMNGEYIQNKLLNNSSYSYVTDTARSTTFNEIEQSFSIVTNSYNRLANSVNEYIDWYGLEMGGAN